MVIKMTNTSIYKDIAERTGGDIYLGIVGPVRTGKSTFIKQFMDKLVLPHMSADYLKERACPILVIYPIELLKDVTSDEVKARFGCDTEEYRDIIKKEKEELCDSFDGLPLMAFAVAFPDKESSKRFIYRANQQKLKELTDTLEITDDEEGEDVGDDQL